MLQNERCFARSPADDTTENAVRGEQYLDLLGKDLDPMTDTRARVDVMVMVQDKKQIAEKTSIGLLLMVWPSWDESINRVL